MTYYRIRQQLKKLELQLEEFVHMPKYCLPFLQPGRLVRVGSLSYCFRQRVEWNIQVNTTVYFMYRSATASMNSAGAWWLTSRRKSLNRQGGCGRRMSHLRNMWSTSSSTATRTASTHHQPGLHVPPKAMTDKTRWQSCQCWSSWSRLWAASVSSCQKTFDPLTTDSRCCVRWKYVFFVDPSKQEVG